MSRYIARIKKEVASREIETKNRAALRTGV